MVLEGVPEMSKHSTKTDRQDRGRFSATRKTEAVICGDGQLVALAGVAALTAVPASG
jgi:hypothetical protein